MKIFLSALFAIFFCFSAASATQCTSDGMTIWPGGDTLFPQSRIMIQTMMEQEYGLVRKALKDSITFVLKSGKSTVKLRISDFYFGEDNTTQIFLIPEKKLQNGKVYTLYAERATDAENRHLAAYHTRWTASDSVKSFLPEKFNPVLTLTANNGGRYGTGKQVIFKTDMFNKNLLLKVRLRVVDGRFSLRTFYYEATGGELRISGEMCYNAILLQGEHQYIVDITPVDAAGNEGEMKTLEFSI